MFINFVVTENVSWLFLSLQISQSLIQVFVSYQTSETRHIIYLFEMLFLQHIVVSTTDPVNFLRNVITNVVRLKRFHVQEHHKYDVLASRLCRLLLDSPNQEMPLIDIQRHFVSQLYLLNRCNE